jgi:heme/copper-type cytochrome/quinol oxidase subunit 1
LNRAVLPLQVLATLVESYLGIIVVPPLIVAIVIRLIRTSFCVTEQDPPHACRNLRAVIGISAAA